MATIRKVEGTRGVKYRVEVRMKGFPPQSANFDRITDAKKWAQDTESAIRERRYFKTAESQRHTVEDMIKRYVKEVLPQKKTTKDVSLHLSYWKEQIGAYMLSDVTPAMLGEVKDRLFSEPIIKTRKVNRKDDSEVIETKSQRNGATVNRYMASMSHCLSVAANEWQWLEVNPMQKVKKLKESRGRVRFLDDDERERLLKSCQESRNPFLYTVVVLAASTGMRHGEIMNLTWTDIDFSNRRIILEETKNGERRAVALVGKALELLTELKKQKVRRIDTNLVFPGSHAMSKGPASLRTAFLVALKRANIENFKFHDLRHSAASYLAMNGASLTDIAAVLGHKTLAMVKRYSHLSDSHVSSVVESMNKKIFG
ncbi:MAG: site-specific integrase [Desulfuromonadales bacterium]